jgi:type I restriction enzyme, R subunit
MPGKLAVMSEYSEDMLIEQPAIELFTELGYETLSCFKETFGKAGTLGRESKHDVVLLPRLRAALARLNPGLPSDAIEGAIEEIARDRSAMHRVHANREVWQLLRDGVKVPVRDERGEERVETVQVIDWEDPAANDFFLASQFWITGEVYRRRPDLILFVNGLPLVLIELKAITKPLRDAFDHNLRDYKTSIPQLFWFNAFIILSNGTDSRIGTITSEWEHFAEWKRVADEDEPPAVSLETMIRGTCQPERLLDLVENFLLFTDVNGQPVKVVAKNHQYLGVNRAFATMDRLGEERGKLGVFWHTQGSGKSFSMLFLSQKVLRKRPGNWTFVVVTDRQELDDQIHATFLDAGAIGKEENVHAESGAHLKQLLREDHRVVFTLIQKFRNEPGHPYPQLSERSDIIVMTDEAHRSQYNTLAMNMRRALPNASFIAFTGTPLIAGEERTRDVFGDYVSIYDFRQSIEDGATVPLFYENRVPEMQLVNDTFNEELEALVDDAMLDPAQERRLEREFAREYYLITDNDRLDRIAADIVDHYLGRFRATGDPGKAMVVAIDKATAVRMYDKVSAIWNERIADLQQHPSLETLSSPHTDVGAHGMGTSHHDPTSESNAGKPLTPPQRDKRLGIGVDPQQTSNESGIGVSSELAFLQETDMAVVVSQAQNEETDFADKGLDIRSHRQRMIREALDEKFKDSADPFRIVFVTAMWMTGFDVPSLSTIYLDKPLRNHTLMQTIARANRVFGGKVNGLIVDYIGIFRNLEQALAIYAAGGGEGEIPIRPKAELVELLRQARDRGLGFLERRGVDVLAIQTATGFAKEALLKDAREAVLESDDAKLEFLSLAASADAYYRAVQPDLAAVEFQGDVALLNAVAGMVRALTPPADISGVMAKVEELLERSLAAEGYLIRETTEEELVDLRLIDFDVLSDRFQKGRQRTEAEKLRARIAQTIARLAELNKSRIDYAERLQQTVDDYNSGAKNVQLYFEELLQLAQDLTQEEQRAASLGLTEEELALFDLLTRPGPDLSPKEEEQVKKAAKELLAALQKGKLVLDWRKKQQAKAAVRLTIHRNLKRDLAPFYPGELLTEKQEAVYQHIYDSYSGQGQSLYTTS